MEEAELKGAGGMKVVHAVSLVAAALLFFLAGIVTGQEQTADSISCALWLQWAEKAKGTKGVVAIRLPLSTDEELEQVTRQLAAANEWREWQGFRQGYATGVFATTTRGPGSHVRNSDEFITAVDALCAGAPQKRLIDVALHILGRR